MIDNNYIVDDTNYYLNSLSEHDKLHFYKMLLDKSIEGEYYEQSAIYHDTIEKIKRGGHDPNSNLTFNFKVDEWK